MLGAMWFSPSAVPAGRRRLLVTLIAAAWVAVLAAPSNVHGAAPIAAMLQQAADTVPLAPIEVQVLRETDYYAGQNQQMQQILSVISNVVAGIMAVGALFAALNSMYTAVSTRSVEIGTLRAIGFGSGSVVVSVLIEAMLLAILGALLGAACAWLLFGNNTISMGNQISSIVFQVRVTPGLVITGIVWACIVGFLGGLLPAMRAARRPVVDALRAV